MSNNTRFIYDEKSSKLYAPDGTFLKDVHCPKALHWNQLIVTDSEDRWRGCTECKERVLNLDVANVKEVLNSFKYEWNSTCISASPNSDKVIFLKDISAPSSAMDPDRNSDGLIIIKTARSITNINRAANLGYWPDVRLIKYDEERLCSKFSIGQNQVTGKIEVSGDYRREFGRAERRDWSSDALHDDPWNEVVPFNFYYPYYQSMPIAAYLVPIDTSEGTKVIVEDPIEDIVGWEWNQGNTGRAENILGHIEKRKIILDEKSVRVSRVVG